jgi:hypothetical protein
MVEHEDLVLAIGPYLLGALDGGTRGALRDHLDSCDTCREELVRLAAVPGLLSHAGSPVPDPDADPSPALRDRLVAQVLAERARHRRRERLAAAAAALLLVLVPAGLFATLRAEPPAPERPYRTMSAMPASGPLRGEIGWTREGWGAQLFVVTEGLARDQRLVLLVESRDGRREQAAAWEGVEGTVRALGATSIQEEDIARFVVSSETGEELLVLETA